MTYHAQTISPARLGFDAHGTPLSREYQDIYFSADGGPGQARHVFLHGNGLPERWRGHERFVILENGFGSGLNFLATWAAWRSDPARPARLHYLAVEKHPLAPGDLARLHRHWSEFDLIASALREAWPLPVPGFQRIAFAGGRVMLTLLLGDAEAVLRQTRARVDAFYLDGFDPRRNPDMWSASVFRQCARLAAPGATLATWCVAGAVRAALQEAGFDTSRQAGFGRKREMLAGHLALPSTRAPAPAPRDRRAIVLGAGLAGCAAAERLASRGWTVQVLDQHAAPASAASGNLAGIVRPMLSRDDNIASRLSRASFLYALRAWRQLDQLGLPPRCGLDGVLQLARDAAHEALQRDLLAARQYPDEYACFLERDAASHRLGATTRHGGWWFAGGGWASPAAICRAWLAAAGLSTVFRGGVRVAAMHAGDAGWRLLDPAGAVLAEAPLVVLATGADAERLAQTAHLPLDRTRGQVSHLPAGTLPALKHALCREGYLTPALQGLHCLGASYAHEGDADLNVAEHAENLRRLAGMLPDTATFDPHTLQGRVAFRATTPDRLPLVGAIPDPLSTPIAGMRIDDLPRLPGMHGLLGLGSRGLVWAALAAEHLASSIEQEPAPLENDLASAIDPARFALRAARRRGTRDHSSSSTQTG